MPLFITTRTNVDRHGVFAQEVPLAPVIQPDGTGVVGLVGRFPWGPDDQVILPTDQVDREMILAPPGMDRTGTGFMAVFGKAWPDLRLVRALGSAAAKASKVLNDTTPSTTAICTVTAKYKGAAGNSINVAVEAATDADTNHWNLRVSVTGASGSTEELHENIDTSVSGAPVFPETIAQSRLIGPITVTNAGRPDTAAAAAMAGGSDGTIDAARYVGTPGNADRGIALFEGDDDIRLVCSDDPGSTDRVAVNAGLLAHAVLLGDRMAILNGNSGMDVAAAKTAMSSNRSHLAAWADGWYYQYDPLTVERLVPPAPLFASILANLPPSTSGAYKGDLVQNLTLGVRRLETPRGNAAGQLTKAGACVLIRESNGGHTFEAAVTTIFPTTPAKKNITRTRMGIYIAKAITESLRIMVDAPNLEVIRDEIIQAAETFLHGLKTAKDNDPINNVHIVDYWWDDFAAWNSQASIDAGDYVLPLNVKTSSGLERIFLAFRYGETVNRIYVEAA